MTGPRTRILTDQLFELAAGRDVQAAVEASHDALAEGRTTDLLDALRTVQERVGERWYRATWTVADEHGATAVVDAALATVQVADLGQSHGAGPHVVVSCPEGEWHSLPGRLLAVELRQMGARVTFLGASMPADHLARELAERHADVLALSVATPLALAPAVAAIDAAHASRVPVVVGGRAVPDVDRASALGADGWAADAADLLWSMPIDVVDRRDDSRRAREVETFALELARPAVVERAMRGLRSHFPPMESFDRRQLARTREDFDYIARFVEASVLVDDPLLFEEYVTWLDGLLAARDLPPTALPVSLDCLADAVLEAPRVSALIRRQSARLRGDSDRPQPESSPPPSGAETAV